MKRIVSFALMAVLAVALVSCGKHYKYESVKGDPTGARIYTLDNGLKIYTIVNKDKPRIDAQIAVKVGSKNDPRETTGLAHYFEHLMFKGTQQFGTQNYEAEKPLLDEIEALFEKYRVTEDPALRKALYHQIDSISYEASKISIPNEYDKLMSALGASGTNAYTSYDVTCYVENIPSNQIELWAKVQADRFENCVLRGFHTELETIYEEYNMYAAMDQQKAINAVTASLFEHHPYNTDVIGLPSHLKNPSITNVKNYHDQWYVPNNMAVVLSGDFDPDEAVAIVDRYFGGMKPNENLPKLQFEPEKPIAAPIVQDVKGNESPVIFLAWRFPGANHPDALKLDLLQKVLSNGAAGLIDLDVNQQQKTLGMGVFNEAMADYSMFMVFAEPKTEQSFDEVRDIFLAELDKVKKGEFSEDLLTAIINNEKRDFMHRLESTGMMARTAVNCFINDQSWADEVVNYVDRLNAVTKDELVAFVNENFGDNYVQVNKLQEKDPSNKSIDKPQITPIFTNRDTSSQFLKDVQAAAAQVKPIDPVFVDYNKDMSILSAKSGIEVLYKKNVTNGTFRLQYRFETGSYADKMLPFACDYLKYAGTSRMTPEEIKTAFYQIACQYFVACSGEHTYVGLNGLAENMDKAVELLEQIIADAQPNPQALAMLKANTLQERANAKTDQATNYSRLRQYGMYGPENPATNVLSDSQIMALTDEELLEKIHSLFSFQHETLYYGPLSEKEIVALVNETHNCPETLKPVVKGDPFKYVETTENEVIIAPYDANQLRLYSVSNRGEQFDASKEPIIRLYNSYFGGGMNGIVFQEMREARGLCYSAFAGYQTPGDLNHPAVFYNGIYTQNDKLIDALTAFDSIINDMPASETAFKIAKESLISNIRTQRTVKSAVLDSYLNARRLGLDHDINRDVFEKAAGYTLDDVIEFQQEMIKDRKYRIMILGRSNEMDHEALSSFGKVREISTEEIFGY